MVLNPVPSDVVGRAKGTDIDDPVILIIKRASYIVDGVLIMVTTEVVNIDRAFIGDGSIVFDPVQRCAISINSQCRA